MEKENKESLKRVREDNSDDSEIHSPESKRIRVDSYNTGVESDDSVVNSPETKRFEDDLFDILDESDEPAIQGLDSVIKSFEEEILVPVKKTVTEMFDAVSGGSCQPDLGYLLEASDDELGLPPTFSGEEEKVNAVELTETETSGSGDFSEMLAFENEIPSYDSFQYGFGVDSIGDGYNDTGDFVAVGGLFDYSDDNYVQSGVTWQPESLSAL